MTGPCWQFLLWRPGFQTSKLQVCVHKLIGLDIKKSILSDTCLVIKMLWLIQGTVLSSTDTPGWCLTNKNFYYSDQISLMCEGSLITHGQFLGISCFCIRRSIKAYVVTVAVTGSKWGTIAPGRSEFSYTHWMMTVGLTTAIHRMSNNPPEGKKLVLDLNLLPLWSPFNHKTPHWPGHEINYVRKYTSLVVRPKWSTTYM